MNIRRNHLNQHIFKVLPNVGVDPDYLYYALKSAITELESKTHGSTMKHVVRGDFEGTRIRLPPLDEQRRIVDLLSRAEGIVRLRREAQKKAAEIIPALFVDMFGDPATNPMGWTIAPLGAHLAFVTSGSRGWAQYYTSTGARFIRSLDVRMNMISDDDAVYVTPPIGAEAERTRVHAGDVLLTITGSQIGRVAPVPFRMAGSFVSQHVAILRLRSNLSPAFLSIFLSLDMGGQREISRLQYGQTKPGLNLQQIREFQIPVPPQALQERFVERVGGMNSVMNQQASAASTAEKTLEALLGHAFSESPFESDVATRTVIAEHQAVPVNVRQFRVRKEDEQ